MKDRIAPGEQLSKSVLLALTISVLAMASCSTPTEIESYSTQNQVTATEVYPETTPEQSKRLEVVIISSDFDHTLSYAISKEAIDRGGFTNVDHSVRIEIIEFSGKLWLVAIHDGAETAVVSTIGVSQIDTASGMFPSNTDPDAYFFFKDAPTDSEYASGVLFNAKTGEVTNQLTQDTRKRRNSA